jgi:parallel beta-helix repeat protein
VANPAAPVIRDNTITATSIAIDVFGTAQPTILTNTLTTNFIGLRYFDTAAGKAQDNTIGFIPEGGSNRRGVQVNQGASPLLDGNTITNDETQDDIGIELQIDSTSTVTVTNNSICATAGDQPLLFSPNFFGAAAATVTNNDLACDLGSGFALSGGTLQAEAMLTQVNGQTTFVLTGFLTVAGGVTLTIPPGLTLNGQFNTVRINGTLNADGATFTDVFLDYRDSSSGTLQNNTVFGQSFATGMTIDGAEVTLTENVFEGFLTAVLLRGTASVEAEDNIFRSNSNAVSIESANVLVTLRNNEFQDNDHAIAFPNANALFSVFPSAFNTNTFLGTVAQNTIHLPFSLDVSGTLQAASVPYSHDGVNIAAAITVTMEPGVIIQAGASSGAITVNGDLFAVGTATRPVVFSTANPKDGNRWGGLLFRNQQGGLVVSRLEHCIVEFAGTDGITLDNASIPIQDCVITDNSGSGIALQNNAAPSIESNAILQNLQHGIVSSSGSAPLVQNNSIFSNGVNGIQNNDETVVIQAADNFWGDDSGPRVIAGDDRCNTLSNPDASGEEVSDCVNFDPWIRLGPSIEGTIDIISGNGQNGTAGEQLAEPLVVEVRSILGSPLEGIEVIFSVARGDASIVEAMPVLTGADGRAAATVELGLTPGEVRIAVTARDVNSPLATFISTSDAPLLFALHATGGCARDGDINQDGRTTPADVLQVFQHFMGTTTLTACEQAHADVYQPPAGPTRHLTPADALCIFQHFLGIPSCLDPPAVVAGPGSRRP